MDNAQLQALDAMGKLLVKLEGRLFVARWRLSAGVDAVASLEDMRQQLAALDELAVVALGQAREANDNVNAEKRQVNDETH